MVRKIFIFFHSIVHIGVMATVAFNKRNVVYIGNGQYESIIEWTPSKEDEGHNYLCFAATESTGYFSLLAIITVYIPYLFHSKC